jgi:hypothetical protein
MSLTPDVSHLTKETTFSSVAKEIANLPIALDDNYPAGGYPITSMILFNEDKFSYRLLNGYAVDAGGAVRLVFEDVANSKLRVFVASTGVEVGGGVDLSTFTAHCTFNRW